MCTLSKGCYPCVYDSSGVVCSASLCADAGGNMQCKCLLNVLVSGERVAPTGTASDGRVGSTAQRKEERVEVMDLISQEKITSINARVRDRPMLMGWALPVPSGRLYGQCHTVAY